MAFKDIFDNGVCTTKKVRVDTSDHGVLNCLDCEYPEVDCAISTTSDLYGCIWMTVLI